MKKQIFLLSSVLLLSACVSTVQSALQDTSQNVQRADEYVTNNPHVVEAAGKAIQQTGSLIGEGMKVTGEFFQGVFQQKGE
ncbi:hypothetical protein [Wielerella bovis]|uniref:hypothetical protein n=1 Tax=Wielerella bovis TaxID=2917790 RepID=UPI0020199C50|nr:hypothetical protein [Wielerella bovis]MCG7656400.1 hypothetical protein [Wielerella bovis]MCG7658625.1 hypothetical protein [Wielerella bovis]ULJ60732.1 hypothetical protein MIS44_02360 [Wielerella bovis]ULJ62920.1 hypothetical protein MIS46_02290 [Wielerella bovis]ULJ65151.1 hypothetical protein MIS33_02340 [Wielerella bovis]